jgi:hypothetical protein
MINARRLLDDLKRMLKRLEDDLRQRAMSVEAMQTALRREYAAAKEAGRAGEAFEVWREGMLTQAGDAWLLSRVFVRFLEDNGLVDEALLSGPGERREQASDRQMRYFQRHPTDSDRDYLYDVFRAVQMLPAVAGLFDESHNPIWMYGISGDAAKELIDFWRRRVPETGELLHDFTDESWNTRFLGDLYQDLSEEARKRYALLQTPEFVEEFILDRTLEPAIAEFGLKEVRLIDPICGSGHFLLGAFQRILDRRLQAEPATPERALVQRALDAVSGQDDFVSVTDVPRETFAKHPWSIGGGSQLELTTIIEQNSVCCLLDKIEAISSLCITREDEAYLLPQKTLDRMHIRKEHQITSVQGDQIRDWQLISPGWALFPYDSDLSPASIEKGPEVHRFLWPMRELLRRRRELSGDHRELGRTWWEWNRFLTHRFRTPLSIAFAFVATHNHFVLDRGGKVFNRSAPIIKLPADASEDDHLALLGLLNSSPACFWMKQVFHNKGSTVDEGGARQTTIAFENFYEFTGTGLQKFPVTEEKPQDLASALDRLAQERQAHLPIELAASFPLSRVALDEHKLWAAVLLRQMIALQEELDWRCYTLYGLTDQDLCYRELSATSPGHRSSP